MAITLGFKPGSSMSIVHKFDPDVTITTPIMGDLSKHDTDIKAKLAEIKTAVESIEGGGGAGDLTKHDERLQSVQSEVSAIKSKVDTLQNANLSPIAKTSDLATLATSAQMVQALADLALLKQQQIGADVFYPLLTDTDGVQKKIIFREFDSDPSGWIYFPLSGEFVYSDAYSVETPSVEIEGVTVDVSTDEEGHPRLGIELGLTSCGAGSWMAFLIWDASGNYLSVWYKFNFTK